MLQDCFLLIHYCRHTTTQSRVRNNSTKSSRTGAVPHLHAKRQGSTPPVLLRTGWPGCAGVQGIHFSTGTRQSSKFELGVGGFCHTEENTLKLTAKIFFKPNLPFAQRSGVPFQMENENQTHTHNACRKETVLYRCSFLSPGN